MKAIDVRTRACPGPVIELKQQFAAGTTALRLQVRDELARSNVTRFARSRQAQVESEEDGSGGFFVTIRAGEPSSHETESESPSQLRVAPAAAAGPVVVQVSTDQMGAGDPELGKLLLRGFLKTQLELDPLPDKVLFYNGGIDLCCEGSRLLGDLQALEARGVEIIVCGTCLNFFGKSESLRVGRVTDMLEIATCLAEAGTVVRP